MATLLYIIGMTAYTTTIQQNACAGLTALLLAIRRN